MTKNYYVTTPIYYVNGDPHVGSAYPTIATDVLARYKKLKGYNTYFLTGTDEHGQKVEEAANSRGITAKELVDEMAPRFAAMWKKLNIKNDDFIRTTEERHKKSVYKIMKKVMESGDIYLGEYEGLYCVPCETFVPESQTAEGNKCPDCGRPLTTVKESSYFFKMSKYQDQLLKYIEDNPGFIQPEYRKNEVVSFIKQGLKDLSISRNTFKWGIPLEANPEHVVYVWFDALVNYITAVGYENNQEMFDKYWNNAEVVHIIGKDILRFHAVIWPTMLMSAGIKIPTKIYAHGWWTSEGEKMSKSKGNVVDPASEAEKYGIDAFRYFVLREVPFGSDGDYSRKAMVQRINSDLANDLGNLLNRTIGMSKKYFDGVVVEGTGEEIFDTQIKELFNNTLSQLDEDINNIQLSKALETIWRFISRMNKYIDETMPWSLAKDEAKKPRLAMVMYNLVEALYKIAVIISPIMPDTANEILRQLGTGEKAENIMLDTLKVWGNMKIGTKLEEAKPIFPRVEFEESTETLPTAPKKTELKKEEKQQDESNQNIGIEEFKKVKIQVAKILEAGKVEGADKLLKFKVSLGNETRSVISGIAKFYDPVTLVGKKVLMVTNLKPVKMKGILSEGMLLSTSDNGNLKLIEIDDMVPEGSEAG